MDEVINLRQTFFSPDALLVGVITFLLLIATIRASKIRIKDAVFWIVWSLLLAMFSFFPNLNTWFLNRIGIEYVNNLFLLLVIIFSYFVIMRHNIRISQQEDKIKELTQIIAIYELEQKKFNIEIESKITMNCKDGD